MELHHDTQEVVWKDIAGFDGIYQINKYGVVKNTRPVSWIGKSRFNSAGEFFLNSKNTSQGYGYVTLSPPNGGKVKRLTVHRLVALHFVDNPNNYPNVHHINSIRIDCFYKNLEWCTQKTNMRRMHEAGRSGSPVGEKHPRAKLTESDVVEIRKLYSTGEYSQQDLAKVYGINRANISTVVRNTSWKHVKSA